MHDGIQYDVDDLPSGFIPVNEVLRRATKAPRANLG